MWIKICANTNLEDALLAAELGADAVGFVFAPSSRQVTYAHAAAIVSQLPTGLEKVGVFPTWPADWIIQAAEQASLTAIQLHGAFDPDLIRILHQRFIGNIAIVQAVHWNIGARPDQPEHLARQIDPLASMPEVAHVLIDSKVGPAIGGTGIVFPWRQAQNLFRRHPKMILAGGLTSENVGEAIHQLLPWGIDVASGVEASPGKKSPRKLKALINAARNAPAT